MKKIRKIAAIVMLIAVLCVLVSCEEMAFSQNAEHSIEEQAKAAASMQRIASNSSFYYYRDTITDVMYLEYHSTGLTVMLDPETGLPLTYARFVELYENSIMLTD